LNATDVHGEFIAVSGGKYQWRIPKTPSFDPGDGIL
jgi:hypothetical protein